MQRVNSSQKCLNCGIAILLSALLNFSGIWPSVIIKHMPWEVLLLWKWHESWISQDVECRLVVGCPGKMICHYNQYLPFCEQKLLPQGATIGSIIIATDQTNLSVFSDDGLCTSPSITLQRASAESPPPEPILFSGTSQYLNWSAFQRNAGLSKGTSSSMTACTWFSNL